MSGGFTLALGEGVDEGEAAGSAGAQSPGGVL